ncbi:hypothetical protein JX265_001849 [Neoarthrinium moseri]|uniref:Nucleolar 27S pre-rRNA processing Urb2/Npa2 C-terminal domain-containing protein n=1 Tax=Neoarthrinium moseri TaxID=1658444 RepID=A0A9P9WWA2_9PEZI|nr:hypothetical protein JX265_001849 [Neoarthrinium moseri]
MAEFWKFWAALDRRRGELGPEKQRQETDLQVQLRELRHAVLAHEAQMANGDFHVRQLALIKAARSLEQDTTRQFDEKINGIWQLLAAAKGGKSSAAEETILRWLLKHMDGAAESAEQLRRYPLAWTTLGCLFERIPLFSLSKIFIERRLLPVLKQSVKDVSKPQQKELVNGDAPAKRKRKRDEQPRFDIEYLRSPEALVGSATELFGALNQLLSRLEDAAAQKVEHITIGAEHVRSLFRVPASEAQELVAPLLWICARSLDTVQGGLSGQQQQWIRSLTTLWEFHLGSSEDPNEFASRLYFPCCVVLEKLRNLDSNQGSQPVRQLWIKQVERMLMKNLINPTRTVFVNGGGLGIFDVANAATLQRVSSCVQILWKLSLMAGRNSEDPESKSAHLSWTQSVFKLLLEFAVEHKAAKIVVLPMLDDAIVYNCPPDSDTLRRVCTSYGLEDAATNWLLVADIVKCDPDVFLLNDELLNTLFTRTSSVSSDDPNHSLLVHRVVNPMAEAFARARDLTAFVQRWHAQLSQLLNKSTKLSSNQSVWVDLSVRQQCGKLLQESLSTKQLSSLVDWLEGQDQANGSYLVILDAICQGVHDEAYISALGSRLFDISFQHKSQSQCSPEILSLRWRITGTTTRWVPSGEVHRIWKKTKADLSKVLSEGALSDRATYEAFTYCSNMCLVNLPHGPDLTVILTLARSFLQRLAAESESRRDTAVLSPFLNLALIWLPQLSQATDGNGTEWASEFMGTLFSRLGSRIAANDDEKQMQPLLEDAPTLPGVEDSISMVEQMISPIIDSLENANRWTQSTTVPKIAALLTFPKETLTKERRKQIMTSWKENKSHIDENAASDVTYAKLILRLLVQVMSQPTFYTGIAFADIRNISAYLSAGTVPYVDEVARLMISQIIANPEASPEYLRQMQLYVKDLDVEQIEDPEVPLILLKNIVVALDKSSTAESVKDVLDRRSVLKRLRELVEHSLSQLASKLKKPAKVDEGQDELLLLDLILRTTDSIKQDLASRPIKLSSKTVTRLENAGETLASRGIATGWKLQIFLAQNQKTPDSSILMTQASRPCQISPEDQWVNDLVDAVTRESDAASRLDVLAHLVSSSSAWQNPSVPYMIISRLIDTIQVTGPLSVSIAGSENFDLARLQVILIHTLSKSSSLEQFKNIAQVVELLLDKHANSMTQVNIEATLDAIASVCSASGPDIKDSNAAGEIFASLYRLAAIVIRRHRLRLEGHHHLLVTTLQALLRVLLANPSAPQSKQIASFTQPPWLETRLTARHAVKFTRLLTLICEPSAASVARRKNSSLDSATDVVKRSAGQYMFRVLMLYIKLQLEGDVPRDVRKELQTGFYSILSVTPESCLRIMNESMDASGRAIFRTTYADFKKFGKWTGI